MKKILAVLFIAIMVFSLGACGGVETQTSGNEGTESTAPSQGTTGNEGTEITEKEPSAGLEYFLTEDGESYYVTGIGTCKDTDIVIPSIYEGKVVTGIGRSAFCDCDDVTSIIIPNRVSCIGVGAFSGCSSLTSIVIPESVTSIEGATFWACMNLESITIPDTVTSIGYNAFYNCVGLKSITIPDSVTTIDSGAFANCMGLKSITFGENSQLTSIGKFAFYNCSGLKNIAIPNGVTRISEDTFTQCTSLKNVTFGEDSQLTSIDGSAFSSTGLVSITIPDGVVSIGADEDFTGAFGYCNNLTNVSFGENSQLTSIGTKAFTSCKRLTDIVIPNSVTSIGEDAFSSTGLKSITIPGGVKSIGKNAFDMCFDLNDVTFGEDSQLTSIGEGAFGPCPNLTYNGTIEQWNAISKSPMKVVPLGCTIHCTDGDITYSFL